jgi:glycosyltransferase involved in cell wall biosynthesis
MRVLVSAYAFEPGGSSELGNGWNWAVALAQLGHEVTVLTTPRTWSRAASEALARAPTTLQVETVDVPPRVRGRLRGQLGVYWDYLAWQRVSRRAARALLTSNRYDIVHHLTWGSLQLGSGLAGLHRPFVFGPVGGGQIAPRNLRSFHRGRWATEAVRTVVTRDLLTVDPFALRTARSATLVLANNSETMRAARRLGASTVAYCSEIGLDPSALADGVPDRRGTRLRLLWVGRVLPRKALPLALAAVSRVPRNTDVLLTVAGYGALADHVESWIDEFSVRDRVRFIGQVPRDELDAIYAAHHALLFTSIRDSSGAQILEAMGNALPVIALDHQGARHLVADGAGIRVPIGGPALTVRRLAEAIQTLAADEAGRVEMAEAALRYARSQTWPRKAQEMTHHYLSALGRGS